MATEKLKEASNAPKNIVAKLAKIGEEIGKIDKTGKNSEQNYAYIEYAVLGGRIRPLFARHGLIFVPSVESIVRAEEVQNKYGRIGHHYILDMRFTIIDADDPNSKIESKWLGEAIDYGDKGINKAETSGTKYFLMRLFHVTEKSEQEADAATPEAQPPRNKPWQKYSTGKPTEKQISLIKNLLKEGGATEEAMAKYLAQVKTFNSASQAINKLKARLEEKEDEEPAPEPSDEELENIDFPNDFAPAEEAI